MKIKSKKIMVFALVLGLVMHSCVYADTTSKNQNSQENMNSYIQNRKSPKGEKLIGEDRFDTAIKISQSGWNNGSERVFLVNSNSLPDALASTPLASKLDAPILLTNKNNVPENVEDEITRLNPEEIILIGSEGAISSSVKKYLEDTGILVSRIGGADREETSLLLTKQLDDTGDLGVSKIAVVNGYNGLADATSISSPAASDNMAIIYASKDSIRSEAKSFITQNSNETYIIGGEYNISKKLEGQLVNSERLAGTDRKDTNAKVLEKFYGKLSKVSNMYFAKDGSGREADLVDGLAAGVLAAKTKSPVILASGSLSNGQQSFIKKVKADKFVQVGGGKNSNPYTEALGLQ
ncbi:cell wall-binding repeat-containing protein [Clostridioides sp. ZZV15-6388]|uniref:cell wall-binding repeat-containing protein n=1 Tax=unclassified Clostridioides TaxID=2635829 RepID=UPI001D107556|nr:cell wall-binding repeat-containing protein [Clostridioides sp. ZZV15-6388]MCC0663029.1 cell wall-binding repeat-containing protein [Clostridioides sp. ZZV15-6597]